MRWLGGTKPKRVVLGLRLSAWRGGQATEARIRDIDQQSRRKDRRMRGSMNSFSCSVTGAMGKPEVSVWQICEPANICKARFNQVDDRGDRGSLTGT